MIKVLHAMPNYYELCGATHSYRDHPWYLMINLETGCPLRCKKCAEPGQRREMADPLSLRERSAVICQSSQIGVKAMVIIGAGEPTAHHNFRSLVRPTIETAHENGLDTVIFTTGLGLNEEQVQFFCDHRVTVVVSLDSLDVQTYRLLTGNGNLEATLKRIQLLRDAYRPTIIDRPDGVRVIRLGINTTIQRANAEELTQIRQFAADDMLYIANSPMPHGQFAQYQNWDETVGDENLIRFGDLARRFSETGGHSSIADGACSYFLRGISVDVDGQMLSCAYAAASASHLPRIQDLSTEELLQQYRQMRQWYQRWTEAIGRHPSCPLRDGDYAGFLDTLSSVE